MLGTLRGHADTLCTPGPRSSSSEPGAVQCPGPGRAAGLLALTGAGTPPLQGASETKNSRRRSEKSPACLREHGHGLSCARRTAVLRAEGRQEGRTAGRALRGKAAPRPHTALVPQHRQDGARRGKAPYLRARRSRPRDRRSERRPSRAARPGGPRGSQAANLRHSAAPPAAAISAAPSASARCHGDAPPRTSASGSSGLRGSAVL